MPPEERIAATPARVPPAQPPAAGGAGGEAVLPPELANHPRFRVVGELGRGGMGVVYRAEHKLMGRAVALKVMSPHGLDDPAARERFRREVRAAARLQHEHIVAAFD